MLVTQTMIASRMNLHAEGPLLYTITVSAPEPRVAFRYDRGAIYRYLARFAELDDAKIFTPMVTR